MPLYSDILSSHRPEHSPPKADGVDVKTTPPITQQQEAQKAGSTSSMKFLQDHLESKRKYNSLVPRQASRQSSQASTHESDQSRSKGGQLGPSSRLEATRDLDTEYDPMAPNSYELLLTEHLRQRDSAPAERKSLRAIPNLLDMVDKLGDLDDLDDDDHHHHHRHHQGADNNRDHSRAKNHIEPPSGRERPVKGTAIAPPASLAARSRAPAGDSHESAGNRRSPEPASKVEQGQNSQEQQPQPRSSQAEDSTRVLLLRNMVGPGEVDDELEAETKEECKKYGDVARCLIYEIPNKRVPDHEAVRIFIEFRQVESAVRAASDLNGRYFGGRVVRATFYSVERFNKYELGAPAD